MGKAQKVDKEFYGKIFMETNNKLSELTRLLGRLVGGKTKRSGK